MFFSPESTKAVFLYCFPCIHFSTLFHNALGRLSVEVKKLAQRSSSFRRLGTQQVSKLESEFYYHNVLPFPPDILVVVICGHD